MNTTKQCSSCNIIKNISEFQKRKNRKCGTTSVCKKCSTVLTVRWKKSLPGVIAIIYNSQKDNSKRRNHPIPTYTKQELSDWLLNDWMFNMLYDNWVNCGYQKSMKPSVDREEDVLPYCFSNQLNIVTWGENCDKGHLDRRRGVGTQGSVCKKVFQYTKSGDFVAEHYSQSEASRQTGVCQGDISACCLGKSKTAGSFKWAFA